MPIFHDSRSLSVVSKRPMLGMVTMLQSETLSKLRRRNAFYFAGGLTGLFAAFVAVFAFFLLLTRAS
jgi:hypothetical protein